MDRDYELVNDPNVKIGWIIMTGIEDKIKEFILQLDENPIVIRSRRLSDGTGINIACCSKFNPGKPSWNFFFSFSLTQMPGNCGILVSHGMEVNEQFRGKGLANFLQGIKNEIAVLNGYTQLYCTTVATNDAQNHILEKYSWKKVNTFINRRTGNTCYEWIKEVQYE